MGKRIILSSGKEIGKDCPCFIVAEIGNNHQGQISLAREMVKAASEIGVDGVKFQKRNIQALLTRDGRNAPYKGPNSFGSTYGEHREALELSVDEMAELKELAESLGLVFFVSVWDEVSLAEMHSLGTELFKVCSADLVNIPLLRKIGDTHVPVILSTGMSTLEEIDVAVAELEKFHSDIILLHCNSSYPCPEDEISLPVIKELVRRYEMPVGYSGHERGLAPTLAAVVLGACMVERHFTLDKKMPGTDHQVSLEPAEFKQLVTMIREVEKAMLIREKRVFSGEKKAALKLRKSIVAAQDIMPGTIIEEKHLTVKSPGIGISPLEWDQVIGKKAISLIKEDTLIAWDMLD